MFRFKLRTLLFTTALVGLLLALQVHVHLKAKRFVEKKLADAKNGEVLGQLNYAVVNQISVSDFLLLRRSCDVSISDTSPLQLIYRYRVPFIGEPEKTRTMKSGRYTKHQD